MSKNRLSLGSEDTICAISTPAGKGGVALIRISGDKAQETVKKACPFLPKKLMSHRVYYGFIKDENKEPLDEVLVSYFKKKKSFTGEDTCEISCHGSPLIAKTIIKLLIKKGVRLAERGEFTYRSFLNGRIDLMQAESICQLVEGETELTRKWALRQLKGSLSKKIEKTKKELIDLSAYLEAGIDFSTEGIELLSKKEILQRLSKIEEETKKLLRTYQEVESEKKGFAVCLLGPPNAGKSSLFNALIEEDKAIVDESPGTTRDLVEGKIVGGEEKVSIFDMAGFRDVFNKVEKIGISKARNCLKETDTVAVVLDLGKKDWREDLEKLPKIDLEKTIFIGNKTDKIKITKEEFKKKLCQQMPKAWEKCGKSEKSEFFVCSALLNEGIEQIKDILVKKAIKEEPSDFALISSRQYETLAKVEKNLNKGIDLVNKDAGEEFVIVELQEAIFGLLKLRGQKASDEVMDHVFGKFCIGK